MAYKITGTTTETTRIIILKESDWSIESNTVISGSGDYNIEDLDAGNKLVVGVTNDDDVVGWSGVAAEFYVQVIGNRAIVVSGGDTTRDIEYFAISSLGNGATFGDMTTATQRAQENAVTSNGANDRGITCGGWGGISYHYLQAIDYVTISTTAQAQLFGDLTSGKMSMDAMSNKSNNRAIVAGEETAPQNRIEYITLSSLGDAASFGEATIDRRKVTCISNAANNRGLIAGGYPDTIDNDIEYVTINSLGNAATFGEMFARRSSFGGCSNGTNNRGIFAGAGDSSGATNIIEYINISSLGDGLEFGDLTTVLRYNPGCDNATSNRGIFPGGWITAKTDTIQYITISTTGNADYFGDLTVARIDHGATANAG